MSYAGHSKGEHSKGFLADQRTTENNRDVEISFHHNYMCHASQRMPAFYAQVGTNMTVDAVNNVVFDWVASHQCAAWGNDINMNWVHNYAKAGDYISYVTWEITHDISAGTPPYSILYVNGNLGLGRDEQSDPHWNVRQYSGSTVVTYADYGTAARWTAPAISDETTMSVAYASEVLTDVGANKCQSGDCQDTLDAQWIADYANTTTRLPVLIPEYPADYPTLSTPAAPTDSDNDGMADAWEMSMWGDLDQTAITDANGDGYNDLETYLHYLAGYTASSGNTTKATPGTTTKATAGTTTKITAQ